MTTVTVRSDKEIQIDILKELEWDPQIDAIEVGARVADGVVTLTGQVATYAKKLAAMRAAHRVAGVLDVVNNLTVEPPHQHQKSDQVLARAVRHTLEWDVLVPDSRIHTTVTNGFVTLEGEVDGWADKLAAEVAVEHLAGVRGLDNRIDIKVKQKFDAGAIREAIESALVRQAQCDVHHIGVHVQNGFVTLSGTVQSWTQKNAIHNVAAITPGVRHVNDLLAVDLHR